jgi:hypothetical protein
VTDAQNVSATTGNCGIVVISLSIISLKPTKRVAGAPAFTLTVQGSNFRIDAAVLWDGQQVATTYVDASQLKALIPASLIAKSGTALITVVSGEESSNSMSFTIADPPAIRFVDPENIATGGPDLVLTVSGRNFTDETVVLWNGGQLTTTFVDFTLLRATVPARLIAADGKARITALLDEVTSNAIEVTMLTPVIASLEPSTVMAGGPAFTLTANGSGFARGAVVQWNGSPLTTNVVSFNQVTATVPETMIGTAQVARITISFQTATSNPGSVSVIPSITSVNPATVVAGGSSLTMTVNGAGYENSATVFWNQTALQTTFIRSTQLTASVPTGLISSAGRVQISVNSGGLTSNAVAFTVTGLVVPPITITGLNPTPAPTDNTSVGVQLEGAVDSPLDGTLTLTFRPAAGVPAGARDPFLQFASGGTTLNFTVPAGATIATLPQNGVIQQGTIAGDIVVTLTRLVAGSVNVLPQPAPSRTLTVPRLAPVITPNSVRILNVTANSLDVEATAYSTTLDLFTATHTFEIASGVQVLGSATVTVDVRTPADQWYATSQYGGQVRLRVRFPIEGDPNVVQRVTLTLTNSVGSSIPVSGGR